MIDETLQAHERAAAREQLQKKLEELKPTLIQAEERFNAAWRTCASLEQQMFGKPIGEEGVPQEMQDHYTTMTEEYAAAMDALKPLAAEHVRLLREIGQLLR